MSVEKNRKSPETQLEAALGKLGNKVEQHTGEIEKTLQISESISGMEEKNTHRFCSILENVFLQNTKTAEMFRKQEKITA